ncbi:MAG: mandelate racemase/muconate lactonizing enzyme family protein [Gammaproteobacteria bacterium]
MTEAIVVRAESPSGIYGLGEGCPRSYVTGESIGTALNFFEHNIAELSALGSLADLQAWLADHQTIVDENPSAFCAVELALLNVFAGEAECSVEELLSLPPLNGEFQYSAIIGSDDPKRIARRLAQYVDLGFKDFKVKLCGQHHVDAEINSLLQAQTTELRVRFDANNLWRDTNLAIDYLSEFEYPIFALEEPLQARDFNGCKRLYEALGTRIILDESFTREPDFDAVLHNPNPWIINLRVSKMGGCLRSIAIAEQAKLHGIPLVVGAQVGETSILTRAALTIANTFRDIVVAQEGAFGTHLLEYDICDPPLMFGPGGIVQANQASIHASHID